eukprot:TRINITY_DN67_c1_g3_i1.p1 TRINITY_DN67_c1_g3~~TRINITY_DN67_c1_g3_i1.p1  ORF type:complete len:724 (+),score=310.60 TRINITY_DN67_c1_g3_i1:42-2213(+)
MRFLYILYLVLCAVLLIQAQNTRNFKLWEGAWADNCDGNCVGGILYLCVNEDNRSVSGTYSNLGHVVGLFQNNGRTVVGNFYEPGYALNSYGNFTWTLSSNDATNFVGEWWFEDEQCVRYEWNGAKFNDFDNPPSSYFATSAITTEEYEYENEEDEDEEPHYSDYIPGHFEQPLCYATFGVNDEDSIYDSRDDDDSSSSSSSSSISPESSESEVNFDDDEDYDIDDIIDNGDTIEGIWRLNPGEEMYICFNDDDDFNNFVAYQSFNGFDNNSLGVLRYSPIGRGKIGSSTTDNGISLFLLQDRFNLVELFWDGIVNPSQAITNYEDNFDNFGVRKWTRLIQENDDDNEDEYEGDNNEDEYEDIDDDYYIDLFDGVCNNTSPVSYNWNGVFTDSRFGGNIYLCTDGTNVWGTYSEIGFLSGVINPTSKSVRGTYYDSGIDEESDDSISDNSGSFLFVLQDDGTGFIGTYTPRGTESTIYYEENLDDDNSIYFTTNYGSEDDDLEAWTGIRLDNTDFFSDQCITPAGNPANTLLGTWYYGPRDTDVLYLCDSNTPSLDDDNRELIGSYLFNNGQPGYLIGHFHSSTTTMTFKWFQEGASGIGFGILTSDNQLTQTWWRIPDVEFLEDNFQICDGSSRDYIYWNEHFSQKYPRFVSNSIPTTEQCSRFEYLLDQGNLFPSNFPNNYFSLSTSSDSSSLLSHNNLFLTFLLSSFLFLAYLSFNNYFN